MQLLASYVHGQMCHYVHMVYYGDIVYRGCWLMIGVDHIPEYYFTEYTLTSDQYTSWLRG